MMNSRERKKLVNVKQEDLLNEMGVRLAPLGYARRGRTQTFLRSVGFGSHAFHLGFADYGREVDVTGDVGIRFDDIEELVNRNNENLSESQKTSTFTLGDELGNIRDGRRLRWQLDLDSNVTRVADQIVRAFADIGVPYLEKYSSREELAAALFSSKPVNPEKEKRALALAFLKGVSRAELERIVAERRQLIEARDDRELGFFDKFAIWLLEEDCR